MNAPLFTTSSRLFNIEESSTLALNALAKKMKSEGHDIVNLTAGEPDFPTPKNVITAAQEALSRGETRYVPTAGLPALRETVAKSSTTDYGINITPAQILISCGVKHSLYNLMQALVEPGDEVIIPSPYWLSYPPMVQLAGGKPVIWKMHAANNFLIEPGSLKPLITSRTKAILFNSPSNPTGAVQDRQRLEAAIKEIGNQKIFLIFDDIYNKITFDDNHWVSPYSLAGINADMTIAVNGVSKSYAMTGFRIGWTIAPAALISRLSSLQSHSTSSPSTISQWAAIAALTDSAADVEKMRQAFAQRRDLIVNELAKIPHLPCPKIGGAFYAYPDFSAYVGTGKPWKDTQELASHLLNKHFLALVPGNDFGTPNLMRISFAASDATIVQGIQRLADALKLS